MSRRQIDPTTFGNALRFAQTYRAEDGYSQIEACKKACDALSISNDWAAPMLAFLNDSPTVAESWAERMFNEALNRAVRRIEG